MDSTTDLQHSQTPLPVHPSQMLLSNTPKQLHADPHNKTQEEGDFMSEEEGEIIEESSVLPMDVTTQETLAKSPSKKKSKSSRKRFLGCSYIGEYTLEKKIGEGTFGCAHSQMIALMTLEKSLLDWIETRKSLRSKESFCTMTRRAYVVLSFICRCL